MKKFFVIFILVLSYIKVQSQDLQYARYIIDSLCSQSFFGRAYTQNGAQNASFFIAEEFSKISLNKFNDNYFQNYHISTNTLSNVLDVKIGKTHLKAGTDFMVSLSSPSVKGSYKVLLLDSSLIKTRKDFDKFLKKDLTKKIVLIDKQNIKDKDVIEFVNSLRFNNLFKSAGLAFINDGKLSWGTSDGKKQNNFFKINLLRNALPKKIKRINLTIEAEFIKDYETRNVIGYCKGKIYPDSFFVFTAHYDHLGQMGKDVYFPGANDNASGTAMVMDLAKYYSESRNQPDYSIVFVLVSGEESGLYGSHYLAEHPLFPLGNVKFLINLDMVGTGSEGITIVNGTKFEEQYKKFERINKENGYLKAVVKRGESCNSDHCAFYEKGVPAIFIYAMGSEFAEYHNIYDVPHKLPLTKYNEIFRLLTDFIKSK